MTATTLENTEPKTVQNIVLSSGKSNWGTPRAFFERLDKEFEFQLDAAAEIGNSKCLSSISEEVNSLTTNWDEWAEADELELPVNVFLNPPYGKGKTVEKWIRRAWEQSKRPGISTVVCLVASRTDTIWFHDIAWKYADEIRFLRGRLVFEDGGIPAKNSGTFPSVLVIFRGGGAAVECRVGGPLITVMDAREPK